MAFNVTFFSFSKKENSTKVPTAAGTTYSCQAKLPLDVLNPTIQLQLTGAAGANFQNYNYAHIASFARYYRIRTWRNAGPLWEADLQVDPLASWKTAIGTQSCYVYRSSYSYDLQVPDNMYPTKARTRILNISIPKVWTVAGAAAGGATADSGCYIAGIISKSGTNWYIFTPTAWSLFVQRLQEDNYYESVLTTFGAVEYPEAKVAVNPMQYISSVKWCPVGYGAGSWNIPTGSSISNIDVGVASVSIASLGSYQCWLVPDNFTTTWVEDIDTQTSDFAHPQADDRGDWLNYSPYTSFEMFYPPFGLFSLDPAIIAKYRYLRVSLTVDCHTCTCKLDIYCHDNTTHRVIYRNEGYFGVDVPVSNIVQPGTNPLTLISSGLAVAGGIASMAFGNVLGAGGVIGGVSSAIGSAVHGQIPHLSSQGGPGSTGSLYGAPRLYVTQWYMADDDLNDKGRPLCSVRTLSAIPGYIQADPDSISIACTEPELTVIRNAVRQGFFYE